MLDKSEDYRVGVLRFVEQQRAIGAGDLMIAEIKKFQVAIVADGRSSVRIANRIPKIRGPIGNCARERAVAPARHVIQTNLTLGIAQKMLERLDDERAGGRAGAAADRDCIERLRHLLAHERQPCPRALGQPRLITPSDFAKRDRMRGTHLDVRRHPRASAVGGGSIEYDVEEARVRACFSDRGQRRGLAGSREGLNLERKVRAAALSDLAYRALFASKFHARVSKALPSTR